jgi:hypothetical protein
MAWLGDLGSFILGSLYANAVPATVVGAALAIVVVRLALRRGWFERARRHPVRSAAVVAAALAVALPVGWYLASPLVVSAEIDEPAPIVASRPSPVPTAPPASRPPDSTPAPASHGPDLTTPPVASPTPVPPLALSGAFHGSDEFHFGRGTARLIETEPGRFVVRLEDFAVRNGPDLYVYVSPSADGYADGAVELGRLKADKGNQNYIVPDGVLDDPSRAASVVIWCKQFSHLFATAPLGR